MTTGPVRSVRDLVQTPSCERMRRPLRGETFLETDRVGDLTFDTWYLPLGEDADAVTYALGVAVDVTDRAAPRRTSSSTGLSWTPRRRSSRWPRWPARCGT